MSWNINCDTCGEDLGKTTENYATVNCSNCGSTTHNPDDRCLDDDIDGEVTVSSNNTGSYANRFRR